MLHVLAFLPFAYSSFDFEVFQYISDENSFWSKSVLSQI